MMLDEFAALLITADPGATKWKGAGTDNYTVYHPYEIGGLRADGRIVESRLKVQVDRYTRLDSDPIAESLVAALESTDDISFRHLIEFEPETGYIHHILDCEVV